MRLGVGAALVDGELLPGDVEVVDGRVAAVGLAGAAGRGIAIPGFVDLQVNGYAGVDFSTATEDEWRGARSALLRDGVTAFQPTFVTAGLDEMRAALTRMPPASADGGGARIVGAHLEGPFLSSRRPGAHDPEALLAPDVAALEELVAVAPVSQVTLAPELPGALDLADALVARGVTVSCGHTEADAVAA
ncbi:MAG TPA: hypothetical protein VGC32_19575, partial [Solirubrobacterales bacterium]